MFRLKLLCILLFVLSVSLVECKWRGGGGRSRWSSGSTRTRVTSSPYRPPAARPTQGSYAAARPTQGSYAAARPTQGSYAQRPTYRSSNVATTPRYNYQSAATRRNYPQQSHTTPRTSYYSTTRSYNVNARPTYQSYPRQPNYQNTYQPGYYSRSPYYTPSYSKYPNLYQPTYGKKDHTVRNTVLAGLGGSALGMYLGYKLGSINQGYGHNYGGYGHSYGGYGNSYGTGGYNSGSSGYGGYPPYSVVHHYHHGEKTIPQNFEVTQNTITQCGNMTSFCTPNTTPLCMTNGTVYCIVPISSTTNCTETKQTNLPCLNTTIAVPCLNATGSNCTGSALNETLLIPCVSSINVFGDFGSNKLEVQHVAVNNEKNDTSVTGQGISNKFCVTVIAEPVKIPASMSNDEFLWYIRGNKEEGKKVDEQSLDLLSHVSSFLFD